MSGHHQDSSYAFPKLRGSQNYREWARHMTLALKEAELWKIVTGTKKKPVALEAKEDDSEERTEKIEQRLEAISDFEDLEEKAIGKIGKMCINAVQMEFMSVKETWMPSDL